MSKVFLGAAIVLAAAALVYEVGANVALTSRAVAHLLSEDPETLRVEYAHARTFWPGLVHVEGLDVRNRTSTVEWQLHIDAADAHISLFSLLRHRFHVSKVEASGVTFRLRLRLPKDKVHPDRVARLPPISGFEAVPMMGAPPDPPPQGGKPWTVDLHGVSATGVREVWIDAFRLEGALAANGGFTLGAGVLTLLPSRAAIHSVDLTTGDDLIARGVKGSIDAQMDPLSLNAFHGAAVLRFLTTRLALAGDVGGVAFLRHFIQREDVSLSGGDGTFRGTANIVHGVVESGTGGEIELEPARVALGERVITGRLRMGLSSGDGESKKGVSSEVGLSELSFTEPGHAGAAATCKALFCTVSVPQLDLAEPESSASDFTASWKAPRVDVEDLHAVDEALPKDLPFHIERGNAALTVEGHASRSGVRAEVEVDSRARVRVWGAPVDTGIKGKVPLEGSFVAGTLDLAGTDLALSDSSAAGWWGRVRVEHALVHVHPGSLALSLAMTARDGAPFLAFYRNSHGSSPVADVLLALIPYPLAESMSANLHGSVHLSASKGALDVKELDVAGASTRLRGALRKRAAKVLGELLVEAGPAAVGISFAEGRSFPVLLDAKRWFERTVAARAE